MESEEEESFNVDKLHYSKIVLGKENDISTIQNKFDLLIKEYEEMEQIYNKMVDNNNPNADNYHGNILTKFAIIESLGKKIEDYNKKKDEIIDGTNYFELITDLLDTFNKPSSRSNIFKIHKTIYSISDLNIKRKYCIIYNFFIENGGEPSFLEKLLDHVENYIPKCIELFDYIKKFKKEYTDLNLPFYFSQIERVSGIDEYNDLDIFLLQMSERKLDPDDIKLKIGKFLIQSIIYYTIFFVLQINLPTEIKKLDKIDEKYHITLFIFFVSYLFIKTFKEPYDLNEFRNIILSIKTIEDYEENIEILVKKMINQVDDVIKDKIKYDNNIMSSDTKSIDVQYNKKKEPFLDINGQKYTILDDYSINDYDIFPLKDFSVDTTSTNNKLPNNTLQGKDTRNNIDFKGLCDKSYPYYCEDEKRCVEDVNCKKKDNKGYFVNDTLLKILSDARLQNFKDNHKVEYNILLDEIKKRGDYDIAILNKISSNILKKYKIGGDFLETKKELDNAKIFLNNEDYNEIVKKLDLAHINKLVFSNTNLKNDEQRIEELNKLKSGINNDKLVDEIIEQLNFSNIKKKIKNISTDNKIKLIQEEISKFKKKEHIDYLNETEKKATNLKIYEDFMTNIEKKLMSFLKEINNNDDKKNEVFERMDVFMKIIKKDPSFNSYYDKFAKYTHIHSIKKLLSDYDKYINKDKKLLENLFDSFRKIISRNYYNSKEIIHVIKNYIKSSNDIEDVYRNYKKVCKNKIKELYTVEFLNQEIAIQVQKIINDNKLSDKDTTTSKLNTYFNDKIKNLKNNLKNNSKNNSKINDIKNYILEQKKGKNTTYFNNIFIKDGKSSRKKSTKVIRKGSGKLKSGRKGSGKLKSRRKGSGKLKSGRKGSN